jgi:glycopeptide antibiotics resistance protein
MIYIQSIEKQSQTKWPEEAVGLSFLIVLFLESNSYLFDLID